MQASYNRFHEHWANAVASGKVRLRSVMIKTWGLELFLYGEHLVTHLSQHPATARHSPLLSPAWPTAQPSSLQHCS